MDFKKMEIRQVFSKEYRLVLKSTVKPQLVLGVVTA